MKEKITTPEPPIFAKIRETYDINPYKPNLYIDETSKGRWEIEDVEMAIVAQMCLFGATVISNFQEIKPEQLKKCYQFFNPEQRYNLVTQVMHFGDSVFLSFLPYQEFLQTVYWRIIRDYIVFLQPECQLCLSTKRLNVHHKTYEDRGWEWQAPLKNLITLCGKCHKKFHTEEDDNINGAN